MKKTISIIMLLMLPALLCLAETSPEKDGNKQGIDVIVRQILESQGAKNIGALDCGKVTQKQLEDLGEAVMDVMHPDTDEHGFMDRMMGGEGSPSLDTMHRFMGARYLGCVAAGVPPMGMMSYGSVRSGPGDGSSDSDWWGMPMYGYGGRGHGYRGYGSWGWPCRDRQCWWGMMGPYGMFGGWIMGILVLAIVLLVVYLIIRRLKVRSKEETPLAILQKRYAMGELTKEEFEQKKKDLGL